MITSILVLRCVAIQIPHNTYKIMCELSVVLIGPQGFPLSVCQSKTNVSVIETESDMSTLNKYMEHSHNHFVSWAHLSIYTRCLKNGSISEDTEKVRKF